MSKVEPPSALGQMLSPAEAAAQRGVCTRTIYTYMNEKGLKYSRHGKRRLISSEDLAAFVVVVPTTPDPSMEALALFDSIEADARAMHMLLKQFGAEGDAVEGHLLLRAVAALLDRISDSAKRGRSLWR